MGAGSRYYFGDYRPTPESTVRLRMEFEPPETIEQLLARQTNLNGRVAGLNSPRSGARDSKPLPTGPSPLQLYSLATPNGQKLGILLEELAAAVPGFEYDAHVCRIWQGDQFSGGFVGANPNSKIPAAVDHSPVDGGAPIRLFESASIMIYLADKHGRCGSLDGRCEPGGRFLPSEPRVRAECLNWVMWQMAGQGPITGNFGHFMVYAPAEQAEARSYGLCRYGQEVQRLCDTLDKHLEGKRYICGDEYTIADMICMPWFYLIMTNGYTHANGVAAKQFLNTMQYSNCVRWAEELMRRGAVQRGMLVCRKYPKPWLEDDRFKHLSNL